MKIALSDIARCFHGIIPSVIGTCAKDGVPNVTYLSEVHIVDETHVALSCQFFNKTATNLRENPLAHIELYDPVTFDAFRMHVRFVRSETSGPLFETMSKRIDAIAAQTGMAGVFKLRSADVCEVLSLDPVPGFLQPASFIDVPLPMVRGDPVTELKSLQILSDRINRARDLDELLSTTLETLDALYGFEHALLLVPDDGGDRLVTLASHGYSQAGVGAEVPIGVGVIGAVAEQKKTLRMAVGAELRYRRAIRSGLQDAPGSEIPMCGLPDAECELAVPLLIADRLVGVLAVESRDPCAFTEWHEAFLGIVANQIAAGIERFSDLDAEAEEEECGAGTARTRAFCFYANDDCVFVDGEYLIRNVPGKILWKVLTLHQREGRTEFTNRELRLDPGLGLPPVKDNLESRLILLRKRLEQKCPDVRIVPSGRGRFALVLSSTIALEERASA